MAAKRDPRYDQARQSFDELEMEEQASFLVEAAASTLARGMLAAGKMLAQGVEEALRQAPSSTAEHAGPGPAEPETSQRQAPRSGAGGEDPR